jgi:hypothetical protein
MATQRRTGSIVGGSILILFGLLALLGQLLRGFGFWGALWPCIIIGLGALFFVWMVAGGKSTAGLAVPGSILTLTGLMLLLQNLSGYWETWSYGWTVIIISVGLGIFIMGAYNGDVYSRKAGLRMMEVGIILLVIFGALFEIVFMSQQRHDFGQLIFLAALILLGLYLAVVRTRMGPGRSPAAPDLADKSSDEQ